MPQGGIRGCSVAVKLQLVKGFTARWPGKRRVDCGTLRRAMWPTGPAGYDDGSWGGGLCLTWGMVILQRRPARMPVRPGDDAARG